MIQEFKKKYRLFIESRFRLWTGLNSGGVSVYRTNRVLTFTVMLCLTVFAIYIYSFYPKLTILLKDGFLFFHFPKIFNLKQPEDLFFENISKLFLIAIVGFHYFSMLSIAMEYFFSCLYISKKQKIFIFVQSNLFSRSIHLFKDQNYQYQLADNLLTRIFGIGTLTIIAGNGELWRLRLISRARIALNEILSLGKK